MISWLKSCCCPDSYITAYGYRRLHYDNVIDYRGLHVDTYMSREVYLFHGSDSLGYLVPLYYVNGGWTRGYYADSKVLIARFTVPSSMQGYATAGHQFNTYSELIDFVESNGGTFELIDSSAQDSEYQSSFDSLPQTF